MPEILGTVVAAPVTTGNTANTFSIGDTNEMQGGHHSVATLTDRNAITAERRREGMTCWVAANSKLYRLVGGTGNSSWAEVAGGAPTTQYVHDQAVPSASWSIVHNLGGYPAVTVVDSAGTTGFGELSYVSVNEVTVSFSAGFSGKAYLVL